MPVGGGEHPATTSGARGARSRQSGRGRRPGTPPATAGRPPPPPPGGRREVKYKGVGDLPPPTPTWWEISPLQLGGKTIPWVGAVQPLAGAAPPSLGRGRRPPPSARPPSSTSRGPRPCGVRAPGRGAIKRPHGFHGVGMHGCHNVKNRRNTDEVGWFFIPTVTRCLAGRPGGGCSFLRRRGYGKGSGQGPMGRLEGGGGGAVGLA